MSSSCNLNYFFRKKIWALVLVLPMDFVVATEAPDSGPALEQDQMEKISQLCESWKPHWNRCDNEKYRKHFATVRPTHHIPIPFNEKNLMNLFVFFKMAYQLLCTRMKNNRGYSQDPIPDLSCLPRSNLPILRCPPNFPRQNVQLKSIRPMFCSSPDSSRFHEFFAPPTRGI